MQQRPENNANLPSFLSCGADVFQLLESHFTVNYEQKSRQQHGALETRVSRRVHP